jgi:protein-tyrosine phosphatase
LNLLFLCSGNYYRSRFAEFLFNRLVEDTDLPWRACSRGLIVDRISNNIGPMSSYTIAALQTRQIILPEPLRFPLQLQEQDLTTAHLVIALKEIEHRPLLTERFPHWTERVDYWHIDDVDCATAEVALTLLEKQIIQLIKRLARHDRHTHNLSKESW